MCIRDSGRTAALISGAKESSISAINSLSLSFIGITPTSASGLPWLASLSNSGLGLLMTFSANACVSRSACAGHLCAKMRACERAHKWTARALSAARNCYVHTRVWQI